MKRFVWDIEPAVESDINHTDYLCRHVIPRPSPKEMLEEYEQIYSDKLTEVENKLPKLNAIINNLVDNIIGQDKYTVILKPKNEKLFFNQKFNTANKYTIDIDKHIITIPIENSVFDDVHIFYNMQTIIQSLCFIQELKMIREEINSSKIPTNYEQNFVEILLKYYKSNEPKNDELSNIFSKHNPSKYKYDGLCNYIKEKLYFYDLMKSLNDNENQLSLVGIVEQKTEDVVEM